MAKPFTILFGFTLLLSVMFGVTSGCFQLPQSIIRKLAKRKSRLHHYLWHVTRDNWLLLTPQQQADLTKVGWGVERPSLRYEIGNPNPIPITDNASGKDFLFMHKSMIEELNSMLLEKGLPKLKGWKKIPAPGAQDFPVPPMYFIPGDPDFAGFLGFVKSDDLYYGIMKPLEDRFTNYDELRKVSLGEMGSLIETGIHMFMHFRFSEDCKAGFREKITAENMLNPIERKWDCPEYNWLADTYSSHVHPTFWMLHYWVNERIEDWRKANGVKTIDWTGCWTGGKMSCMSMSMMMAADSKKNKFLGNDDDDGEDDDDETMDNIVKMFNKAGLNDGRFNFNVENRLGDGKKVNWRKWAKGKGKGKLTGK